MIKKSKKAQGIMGLSFETLWGIFLIIVFIAAAFYGIRAFLNYRDNVEVGMFMQNLKKEVNAAFYAEKVVNKVISAPVPSGIDYACFINFTAGAIRNGNAVDMGLMDKLRKAGYTAGNNFYFYASNKNYGISQDNIDRIKFDRNPICFKRINGKISITLNKNYDEGFVRIS